MYIEHRGFKRNMTGVRRYLMQIHMCPRHVGEAKMPGRMSRKLWQASTVNLGIKLLIFRQLSWRKYFSSFGFGSAISQKMIKEKIL
jgi:hypothetical protein